MTILLNIVIFILGVSVGSFLNVLIDRLPKGEAITGRSQCDFCRKKLRWYDLIPVLSFILLKGKCRYCKKKLSSQYPLVELLTGISFMLISNFKFQISNQFQIFNFQSLNLIVLWGVVSCLIVIFFSDLKYHLISDYVLLAFSVFSFFYHFSNNITIQQYSNLFISGLIVALPIFLIYYLSRERAMGLGDVYLSAIIGFLLGWKTGFLALYIAFVTGAIFGLILILLRKKKLKSRIPFGPFLVIGTVIMLFFQDKVWLLISNIYRF